MQTYVYYFYKWHCVAMCVRYIHVWTNSWIPGVDLHVKNLPFLPPSLFSSLPPPSPFLPPSPSPSPPPLPTPSLPPTQIKSIIQSGIDVPGNDNDLKKLQLQQLAELNGTFKPLDLLRSVSQLGVVCRLLCNHIHISMQAPGVV